MINIEIFSIICSFVIGFIIVWRFNKKPKLQAASGEFLSRWGIMYATPRIYYGNEDIKPAIDCFWDEEANPPGWYETDANLRKRIINKIMAI